MDDQQTCGKGLAENSILPEKLGQVMESMAGVLEMHQKSLDLGDDSARQEHEAYTRVAKECRAIANQLRSAAGRMAGYRDLPMGRHDVQKLMSAGAVDAFAKFVRAEHELLELFQSRLEGHQELLDEMQRGGS